MPQTIEEALSTEASLRFFTFKTDEPPLTDPPEALGWTRAEWDTFSPGMKLEIERDMRRRGEIPDLCTPPAPRKSLRERRQEVEYAGRKRL